MARAVRFKPKKTVRDLRGVSMKATMAALESEKQRFAFFKKFDLIDTGRYWLNRDLKRCLVDDGQVIVIDE